MWKRSERSGTGLDIKSLYREIVNEHNLHPGHKRDLENPTLVLNGVNPSCGDDINLQLKIKDGETSDDGLFSLKTVACLGCCSLSPVMMIDEDTYGSLTPAKAVEIIRTIKGGDAA